jgi:exopolyphosphatase/pppGpp-phosphohydrolase
MNERIKQLAEQAGLQCNKDEAICFAELIVEECCKVLSQEDIRHSGYGYNQHALYQMLREHIGVNNE